MEPASLTSLPDDLMLDIIEHLDTARDVSHLGRAAKRTHRLVEHAGWKTFTRTRFPSLKAPSGDGGFSWRDAADTFTYLDRCWDKHAIQLSFFRTGPPPRRRQGGRQPRQAIDFHGVVDAHHVARLDQEILACGAGEDLHVRWNTGGGGSSGGGGARQTWKSVLGKNTSYAAGTGDVTAIKLVERRAGRPEVVVGRANGDVQILSAASNKSFGKPAARLIKLDEREDATQQSPFSISPGRLAVSCTEWRAGTDMLATCRSSHLHLYNVPSQRDAEPKRLAYHDMSRDRPSNQEEFFIRDVKFLGKDNLAVALGGSTQPIQYGTMRPTGVEFVPAAQNTNLFDRWEGRLEPALFTGVTSVWSIQPVGNSENSALLLSSWYDGSFRLMDARTPSRHDAIYRDPFQPYQAGGPLLVYGTERFVSGNSAAPTLRFFDFRFPKPYFHSNALPCSPHEPQPQVSCAKKPFGEKTPIWSCEPGNSRRKCTRHAALESPCYRPDSTLWLGAHAVDRVFSLAKASDTSDKFYLGLRGAVAEAQLVLDEDIPTRRRRRDELTCPAGWRASDTPSVTIAETGISLCTSSAYEGTHGEVHKRMPEMFYRFYGKENDPRGWHELTQLPKGSRLDDGWQQQAQQRSQLRAGLR